MNFFEKIVTVFLDDKSTKTIILESIDYDSLIIVRNGFLSELSNNQPAVINHSILSDVQVITITNRLLLVISLFKTECISFDLYVF